MVRRVGDDTLDLSTLSGRLMLCLMLSTVIGGAPVVYTLFFGGDPGGPGFVDARTPIEAIGIYVGALLAAASSSAVILHWVFVKRPREYESYYAERERRFFGD